jgi:hypothetical protein
MRERAPSARGVRGSRKHRRQAKCAGAFLITVSWDYLCARETAPGVGETSVRLRWSPRVREAPRGPTQKSILSCSSETRRSSSLTLLGFKQSIG